MTSDEKKLRRMLCLAQAKMPYMDDGEASDGSEFPFIDYMRDTPDEIQAKLSQRNLKKIQQVTAQPGQGTCIENDTNQPNVSNTQRQCDPLPARAIDVRVEPPSIQPHQDFEEWWEKHGQFCRAGGGDYEKTFAFKAWEAAKAQCWP
jgi:hypothetical protein